MKLTNILKLFAGVFLLGTWIFIIGFPNIITGITTPFKGNLPYLLIISLSLFAAIILSAALGNWVTFGLISGISLTYFFLFLSPEVIEWIAVPTRMLFHIV